MIRGIAFINKGLKYQIHATDREHENFGIVAIDAQLDEFNAKITVYDSGMVVIESPRRRVQIQLKDGSLQCG
jgi:hypothetical protein